MQQREMPHLAAEMPLDALLTAVLLLNDKGVIQYANSAAEAITGLSRSTLRGLSCTLFFSETEKWLKLFCSEAQSGPASISEVAMLTVPHSGGRSRPVRVLASEGPGEPGACVLLEFSDCEKTLLAERRESSLDFSEANRQVLRNLAHEIKNPLGGIRGAAQLLEAELENPELREYTSVIISEADRLKSLVDKLLAPYRSKRAVSSVNIHEVLEHVRRLLLAEFPSGLALVRAYDVSVPEIRADREQLVQVFLNLARNAAEALSEQIRNGGGRIRFTTRIVQQAVIGMHRYRTALAVHVIDNGPGIPLEIKDRIFFPLVTGKPQGSGLGLSLAQNFIQQQGGSIDVASAPGCTDFCVQIPLSDPS